MKVQKALIGENQYTWLVLGADYLPIEPIHNFIIYLENLERSPYTIRTYAYHLKLFWDYLADCDLSWNAIQIDSLAYFIHWLRLGGTSDIINLYPEKAKHQTSSINTIIASVLSFYDYQEKLGNIDGLSIQTNAYFGTKRFKVFLHHISKGKAHQRRQLKLKDAGTLPKTLSEADFLTIIKACHNKRDLFLINLLYETGIRIGQAIGLKHTDIKSWDNEIHIVPRSNNQNLSRSKSTRPAVVHVSKGLINIYTDYIQEYSPLMGSEYVFLSLHGKTRGQPISYETVKSLFRTLSQKTGIYVTAHMFRHTHATQLIESGWDSSMIQKRLGHRHIQTTVNTYTHISDRQMKKAFKEYQKILAKGGDFDE